MTGRGTVRGWADQHKRPARQQVRCASFTQTRSLGQRFLCLCLSLSLSIRQVLRSSNAWLSTPARWGRGKLARERKGLGREARGFWVCGAGETLAEAACPPLPYAHRKRGKRCAQG